MGSAAGEEVWAKPQQKHNKQLGLSFCLGRYIGSVDGGWEVLVVDRPKKSVDPNRSGNIIHKHIKRIFVGESRGQRRSKSAHGKSFDENEIGRWGLLRRYTTPLTNPPK